jgi:hypothetical protein
MYVYEVGRFRSRPPGWEGICRASIEVDPFWYSIATRVQVQNTESARVCKSAFYIPLIQVGDWSMPFQ